MAEVSNGSDELMLAEESIEDIFVKSSIPEIQQLSKQYNSVLASTKNDLHQLVSLKYRDLVKIAEDIGNVHLQAAGIDSGLQGLSYKPCRFVSPYNDNYHKFDSSVRREKAKQAQLDSRSVIARNLIVNKLGKLENLIKDYSNSNLRTSSLIYYTKVLQTIEATFKDVLESKEKVLIAKVARIRADLIKFLEYAMSAYNSPVTSLNTSDRFSAKQRITSDALRFKNEIDRYDSDDEAVSSDDDDDDNNNDDDVNKDVEDEDGGKAEAKKSNGGTKYSHFASAHVQGQNTLPICNVLVCYTALVGPQKDIKKTFLEMRIDYLQHLVDEAGEDLTRLNQYQVLRYLENTCRYIETYFDDQHSEYFRLIRDLNKPWKADTILGCREWYENVDVNFKVAAHGEVDSASTSTLFELIPKFLDSFLDLGNAQDFTNSDSLTYYTLVYMTFVRSLEKIENSVSQSVGGESRLLRSICDYDLVSKFSARLFQAMDGFYKAHLDRLNKEEGILGNVQKSTSEPTSTNDSSFFSPDLVNLMDNDIDSYVEKIVTKNAKLSSSTSSSPDAIAELRAWMEKFESLNQVTMQMSEPKPDFRTFNAVIYRELPMLYRTLQSDKVTWGSFSASSLKENITQLQSEIHALFAKEIEVFVDQLVKTASKLGSGSQLLYLAGLFSSLKRDLEHQSMPEMVSKIDAACLKIFSIVVELIASKRKEKLVDIITVKFAKEYDDSADLPTRPSLKLASELYELAREFMEHTQSLPNDEIDLFSRSNVTDLFVKVKDNWLHSSTEKIVDSIKESHTQTTLEASNSTDQEQKEDVQPGNAR
ncbi:uncharacterized protein LODBEIA_P02500 [Lodderomyces beijingensis]|uniref:Exocyst complex component SEC5 n=1 Tax=Lodderomyces beijingensis TaxID=1775926 RepID=A0ABP0ZCX8_9ASCO